MFREWLFEIDYQRMMAEWLDGAFHVLQLQAISRNVVKILVHIPGAA